MQVASAGYSAGLLHQDAEKEDVPLTVRLDRATRSDLERIQSLKIAGRNGRQVALGELVHVEKVIEDKSIYHKNLMPVTYVTADIAGEIESPVYAVLKLGPEIDKIKIPEGYQIEQHMAALPSDSGRYSMKWDGEWHITYEVFRDLGIAFAAVLILIYGLVVGWFQSFLTPLIIMAAIPFSLVGILPAHGLLHAFFTATSMIGFIAGAGIVVRNSIILVDFIELRWREGMPLDAGGDRCRSGALPSHDAHRRRGGGRLVGDSVRSHFPGPGDCADGGRNRFAAALAHDRPGAVLSGSTKEGESSYDCRSLSAHDRRRVRAVDARAGLLGEPVLVSVHRVRRTQSVSIGVYELVSDDDHSSEVGRPQQLKISCTSFGNGHLRSIKKQRTSIPVFLITLVGPQCAQPITKRNISRMSPA